MKLQNAIFYVKNIEKSKDFYQSIGFEVAKDFGKFVSFKDQGRQARLAINLADKPEKVPGNQAASFIVQDIEEHYSKINKIHSNKIIREIKVTDYGKVFFIKDVDGNKIEFVEERQ